MPNLDDFAQRIANKFGVGGHHGQHDQHQQQHLGQQSQQPQQGPAYQNEYMYPPPVLFDSQGTGVVSEEELVLHADGGAYPRLCRLSDGSILLAFTRFEPNPANPKVQFRVLTVHRSTDNGTTFHPHGVVDRCPRDCDNLFLLEVPPARDDGVGRPKVLAAFRNHDLDANGNHTRYRITVCESFNAGKDWKYLSQAHVKATAPNGLWEPFMRIGRRGEVQMTFSQELSPTDQDTMFVTSHDQGATWSPPRAVTGVGEQFRDGMTGIVRTRDRGREVSVMVFETTRHDRNFSIECVLSYDDGYTWGWRQVVYEPSPRGRNAGSPQIEAFGDGSLAVVFMTDEDTPQEQRRWPSSAKIKAVFAGPPVDGRVQWHQPARTVQAPNCFWPGIFKMDDETLVGVFQHGRSIKGRKIVWQSS
ncbi:hypothetical protein SLS53_004818 [Cytospora paraplurivora]|uniref:Uncharacterized protein n=1 Tax=Cytospora paraplurivora TaxID=2898453 RepID=A0AAN9U8X4_9PEZI